MPSIGEVLRVLDGDGIDYLVEGPALSENVEWLIPNVLYPPASMSRGECNADGLALLFCSEGNFSGGTLRDYVEGAGIRCILVFDSAMKAWDRGTYEVDPSILETAAKNDISLVRMPRKLEPAKFAKRFYALRSSSGAFDEFRINLFRESCYGDQAASDQLSIYYDNEGIKQCECLLFSLIQDKGKEERLEPTTGWYLAMKKSTERVFCRSHKPIVFMEKGYLAVIVLWNEKLAKMEIEKVLSDAVIALQKELPSVRFFAAVGAYSTDPHSLQHSFSTALRTMHVSLVFDKRTIVRHFSDWRTYVNIVSAPIDYQVMAAKEVWGKLLDDNKLLSTLYHYLQCSCSLTKTARRLDVHINTVKNRIAKAEEYLSCDLDDENVRFALRADMVSLAYLKHIDAL